MREREEKQKQAKTHLKFAVPCNNYIADNSAAVSSMKKISHAV